jgi:hypothetical protein
MKKIVGWKGRCFVALVCAGKFGIYFILETHINGKGSLCCVALMLYGIYALWRLCQVSFMLSGAKKPFMLSPFMLVVDRLSVIMLSIVVLRVVLCQWHDKVVRLILTISSHLS